MKRTKMIVQFCDSFIDFTGAEETQEAPARSDGRREPSSLRIHRLVEKAPNDRGQRCRHQHKNRVSRGFGHQAGFGA